MIELSMLGLTLVMMGLTDRIIDGVTGKYRHTTFTFGAVYIGILCIVASFLYEGTRL